MGKGKPYSEASQWIRIDRNDYEIIKTLATALRVSERMAYTPIKETNGRLLEIAFRCIEEHGTDFAKPARHHQERERFKALAVKAGIKALSRSRRRGERGKDKKPRKRRAA